MLLDLLGVAGLVFGLFFCVVGVVGVNRLPDALTRLHASCKVASLGLFGLLAGAFALMPSARLRLLVLALFILLTSPVAAHAIAASVHRRREIAHALGASDVATAAEAPLDAIAVARAESVEEKPAPEADAAAIDVTAILSRSRIQAIIEAQERALRQQRQETKPPDDS